MTSSVEAGTSGRTSSTTTSEVAPVGARTSGSTALLLVGGDTDRRWSSTHAHTLLALEVLALRLQRRRNHQLSTVELGDVAVATRRHRGPQAAHQIEGAVVLASRTLDDL